MPTKLLMFVACLAACSHERRGDKDGSVMATGDGPITIGDGSSGCASTCSNDLRSVLDCQGNVTMTCPDDQGCANGGCEPACQASMDNHSAIGCEYYAVAPPVFTQSCFAAFVANTWTLPVTISVDYDGASLDVTKFAYVPAGSGPTLTYTPLSTGVLPAGGIAILFLSDGSTSDCPSGVGIANHGASFAGTSVSPTFHITTTEPVIAYDIFPYGGGSSAVASANLLLPVSVWDVNYVGITAYPHTVLEDAFEDNPWLSIVAMDDDTQVTISPTVDIAGGAGVSAASAGTPATYTLSKGQALHLDQEADLSGSPILSTKPVGLWGGNGCAYIPANMVACDGMHQQIAPVRALGHEYAAVRYRNRVASLEETPPWRIMGVVDGTTLSYDPAPPMGAPTTLMKGQVVEFDGSGPFDVKSQDAMHPFYFAAHMTGCEDVGGDPGTNGECIGDPEFVNVIPQEQYLSDYVFFTDPTYPETNLVFVRVRNASGTFDDVTLDCAGVLTGWMPVDSGDNYEYTRVDLSTGNFQAQGMCDNGRHEAKSPTPFTLTVWGWGSGASTIYTKAVSYAYPAGAGVRSINPVVVPIQ